MDTQEAVDNYLIFGVSGTIPTRISAFRNTSQLQLFGALNAGNRACHPCGSRRIFRFRVWREAQRECRAQQRGGRWKEDGKRARDLSMPEETCLCSGEDAMLRYEQCRVVALVCFCRLHVRPDASGISPSIVLEYWHFVLNCPTF